MGRGAEGRVQASPLTWDISAPCFLYNTFLRMGVIVSVSLNRGTEAAGTLLLAQDGLL